MKKFLLTATILLALLFACGITASHWLANSTGRKVKKLKSEILDAGELLYYTDYGKATVPVEDNAFLLLSNASNEINAYTELVYNLELEKESRNSEASNAKSVVRPDIRKQREEFFVQNSELFTLLEQISQCKSFRPDIDRSRGYGANFSFAEIPKRAIELLADKASLLASSGDGDAAIRTCLTGYRILQLTEQENFHMGFFIECVGLEKLGKVIHQTVTTCKVSDAMLELTDKQLQQFNLNKNLTNTLKVERAIGIQAFADLQLAVHDSDENPIPLPAFFAGTNLGKAYFNDDEAAYIQYMNECISMVNQTKASRDQRIDALIEELSGTSFLKSISKLMTPDLKSSFDAKDDAISRLRALRILLAVTRQPDLHIESLPAEILEDPYSRNNMLASRTSNGWLIYSVGRDLTDDGGNLTPASPTQQTADIGYGPILSQPITRE